MSPTADGPCERPSVMDTPNPGIHGQWLIDGVVVVSLLSWKFDFGLNKISYVTINQLEFKVTDRKWSSLIEIDQILELTTKTLKKFRKKFFRKNFH